jgi:hypothetical protein
MKTSKLLKNLLVIAMFAILLTPLVSQSPTAVVVTFAVLLVAGAVLYMVRVMNGGIALFDGLAPEVWLPLVKEDFYPSNSFLNGAQDMSALVNYDKINFAQAGADPNVLKNNTDYPIQATVVSDSPKAIELDYYDTESSIVRNAVAIELAYDQRALYADKHKKALLKRIGLDAAFAYAPVQNDNSKYNTVLNLGNGDGIIDAVIDLQKSYNACDDDGTQRNLVLCPEHMAMISKEDKVLYKSIMATAGAEFYGFRIWNYSKCPIYIGGTGVKAAFGAAFVEGTHKNSSFSFLKSEVMKAQGTMEMFSTLKDPAMKGDIFNFQMRALVSSLRGRYAGAILK